MENIFDNFTKFFKFSSQLIQKCRSYEFPDQEFIPLTFPCPPESIELSPDHKNQLFVIEFFLNDTKTNSQFLMEQWIFNLHNDKLPQRTVKLCKNERDLGIVFLSLVKTLATLLVNLPLYREYMNKNSKYSSQISHDFVLTHKIIQKPAEISNFQGWNSQKWSQYYKKFPIEDEISFYVNNNSLGNTYKFSFQLNYFKNIFELYKVVELFPIKLTIIEKNNRKRCISEQTTDEIGQKIGNILENQSSNEYIQWKSKNSLPLNESIEENSFLSLTPKSLNPLKNDDLRSNFIEITPFKEKNQSNGKIYNSLKRGFLESLLAINENKRRNGNNAKEVKKNEGAFLNFHNENEWKTEGNKRKELVVFIEEIEEKKKKLKYRNFPEIDASKQNFKDLFNELKKFDEMLNEEKNE